MASAVTNYFSLDGINYGTGLLQDFQAFQPDSSFINLYRVDIYGGFSLDNLVISDVPEPSAGALALLGAACAFWFKRLAWRHHA
jgi:hypothetical protein